jgi:hypothetical protein
MTQHYKLDEDGKTIPEKFAVKKDKHPKGWSYPLQTTQIKDGLDLDNIPENIFLSYSGHPPRSYELSKKASKVPGAFPIMYVHWYAHNEQHFFICVNLVPAKYRKIASDLIVAEVLPIIKPWMRKVVVPPVSSTISLDYYHQWWDSKYKNRISYVQLSEDKQKTGWMKEITLQDGDRT